MGATRRTPGPCLNHRFGKRVLLRYRVQKPYTAARPAERTHRKLNGVTRITGTDQNPPAKPEAQSTRRRILSSLVVLLIYLGIVLILPRPAAVKPEGWRLFGIFAATIAAMILHPIPGGAAVLIAVTLASIFGGLTIHQAFGGYGDPTVWLVMAAFFISDALIKTGLARRIALLFIRTVGQTSLGVCYALSMTA